MEIILGKKCIVGARQFYTCFLRFMIELSFVRSFYILWLSQPISSYCNVPGYCPSLCNTFDFGQKIESIIIIFIFYFILKELTGNWNMSFLNKLSETYGSCLRPTILVQLINQKINIPILYKTSFATDFLGAMARAYSDVTSLKDQ